MKLYACPSRRPADAQTAPLRDQYGVYLTGGWAWGKTDYAANALVFPNRPFCLGLRNLTDGTSQTVLVGEKAMDPNNYTTGTWFWDEPFFAGGSGGTTRDGTANLRDAVGVAFPHNWGAAHPSGAQFLFGDGSVRLLPFSTPRTTLAAILTPSGGEVVPDLDQ